MTTNLNWQQALKEFNSRRKEEGGKHIIPKKAVKSMWLSENLWVTQMQNLWSQTNL